MFKVKYEILKKRNATKCQSNKKVLEQIKRDIIATRSKTKQTIEDLVIAEIKHKERSEKGTLEPTQINPSYNILITDDSIQSPFMVNSRLIRTIKANTRNCISKEDRSRAIYNWIEQNIEYGKIGYNESSYINSNEVLSYKKGICAEMAFLYIAMARSIGLKSNFVSVNKDCFSRQVNHACAAVETEKGLIFVDPAYHTYDVKHKEYRIWKDSEIMSVFGKSRSSLKNGSISR